MRLFPLYICKFSLNHCKRVCRKSRGMGRAPCCAKVGLKRGPWSTEEDALLNQFITQNGEGQWRSLPKKAGLLRCGKSCRLRWMNYLRPGIKRGNIDQDEEDLIVRLHGLLGNRWSLIAGRLPGRTDNEIKNYWNTHLLKKLNNAGVRPKNLLSTAPKVKKSAAGSVKKKRKQVNIFTGDIKDDIGKTEAEEEPKIVDTKNDRCNEVPKTTVYMPKPIRISSPFPRTGSVDSFQSGSSSCDGFECRVAEVGHTPPDWPRFELVNTRTDVKDDFVADYSFLPQPECNSSGNSPMLYLDLVYDEYLQLLLQN